MALDKLQKNDSVPLSQARALGRRLSLDQQQRSFRGTYPAPHILRPRPPG